MIKNKTNDIWFGSYGGYNSLTACSASYIPSIKNNYRNGISYIKCDYCKKRYILKEDLATECKGCGASLNLDKIYFSESGRKDRSIV